MRAMRPTSSVRAVTSIGTARSSFPIIRSISRRCSTMPSLAFVDRVRKGIVNAVVSDLQGRYECSETQQGFSTQMRSRDDLHLGGIR